MNEIATTPQAALRGSIPVLLVLLPALLSAQYQPPPTATSGTIIGTVTDANDAVVEGATVTLDGTKMEGIRLGTVEGNDPAAKVHLTATSSNTGFFTFEKVPAGIYKVGITAKGFAAWTSPEITLHTGESYEVPHITLQVAPASTQVEALATPYEIAEAQLKQQEKQRVLGIVPNFYVSYVPDAAPLSPGQKFRLAGRMAVDPVTFVINAGVAGIEQARNDYPGFGQGAQGYGKRFGANYADSVASNMFGGAIFPSLFHQDPRYYYRGTGSAGSRAWYAATRVFVCKGDNGRPQPNYSFLLGNIATGGLSNLYYPKSDRHGAQLTFKNAGIATAGGMVANLLQEFLLRKWTPAAQRQKGQ